MWHEIRPRQKFKRTNRGEGACLLELLYSAQILWLFLKLSLSWSESNSQSIELRSVFPSKGRFLFETEGERIDDSLPLCRNIGDSRIACLKPTMNDQTLYWSFGNHARLTFRSFFAPAYEMRYAQAPATCPTG